MITLDDSLGTIARPDVVNGVVLFAANCSPVDPEIDPHITGVNLDGTNTNKGAGLIYLDASGKPAAEKKVDAGPVPDGDVDCRTVADENGCTTDGDCTTPTRGKHPKECNKPN